MTGGFNNDVLDATGNLVRQAIQSPNYVAGVSGWIVRQDGSAEFNVGTFRGPVLVDNPPGQGAASYGLTGTAIPAVLRNFDTDYVWYVADIFWIDGTQFFFDALVNNVAFTVIQRMAGIYTAAGGVQLQVFRPANAPNTILYGSALYDTTRLTMTWRASDLDIDSTSTLTVDGSLSIPGTAGVSGALTVSGTETVTGTLVMQGGEIFLDGAGTINTVRSRRKPSDTLNNSAAMTNDPSLSIPLDQSGGSPWHYTFDFFVGYKSTVAQGWQFALVGDGVGLTNANIRYVCDFSDALHFGGNIVAKAVPDTNFHVVRITGTADVNSPGTLTLQWSQTTAGAGPTSVLGGSWGRTIRSDT